MASEDTTWPVRTLMPPSAATKALTTTAWRSGPVHQSSLLITCNSCVYQVLTPYSEVVTARPGNAEEGCPHCSSCGLLNVKRRAVSGLLKLSSATAQQCVHQSSCALTKNPVANSTTPSSGAGGQRSSKSLRAVHVVWCVPPVLHRWACP